MASCPLILDMMLLWWERQSWFGSTHYFYSAPYLDRNLNDSDRILIPKKTEMMHFEKIWQFWWGKLIQVETWKKNYGPLTCVNFKLSWASCSFPIGIGNTASVGTLVPSLSFVKRQSKDVLLGHNFDSSCQLFSNWFVVLQPCCR